MPIDNQVNQDSENYSSQRVQILRGLAAVRKRPGMYIGSTDKEGLRRCVKELVENSVDEFMAGFGDTIHVIIHPDNTVTVKDNGRGIPVDIHAEEGRSAAEVIMTVLHAGSKFDSDTYKVSGGLHGVGASVVNALAEELTLNVHRNGKIYQQIYHLGVPDAPLHVVGETDKNGTEITFKPSAEIFSELEFDYDSLASWLRELAFLNPGLGISLVDEREEKQDFFRFEGGIQAFVEHLNRKKNPVNQNIVYFKTEQDGVYVEGALQWNDGYQENVLCFTNNIMQRDGGTHLAGLRSGLTRTLNQYIETQGNTKKYKMATMGEDVREGLTAVLSVKISEPKFSSQTKEKLVSTEVRPVVENVVSEKMTEFLLEKPQQAKLIIDKIVSAAAAREAARKAREMTRKQNGLEISSLAGRFAPCQKSDPSLCELFIVEGDSAGGSAKQARDRRTQAILPLKGKILNVEKARFDRMISSEEVGTLIIALGCGIGSEEYNPDKTRFHRIIIMTDADVDGAHIRTLLLTFFYRQMPDLISRGYIYIAQPPLYKVKKGKQEQYVKDDSALMDYLTEVALEDALFFPGEEIPPIHGQGLEQLLIDYRKVQTAIERLSRRYPRFVLEQLVNITPLQQNQLPEQASVQAWQKELQNQLDNQRTKATFSHVEVKEDTQHGGFLPHLAIVDHGMASNYVLSYEFFATKDYQIVADFAHKIQDLLGKGAKVVRNNKTKHVHHFAQVERWLMDEARKGQSIQRYKGLGEMNPDQLWETTMNPESRRMLQVSVRDVIAADEIFSTLMGDNVEPRRDFIETNALNVENLDV